MGMRGFLSCIALVLCWAAACSADGGPGRRLLQQLPAVAKRPRPTCPAAFASLKLPGTALARTQQLPMCARQPTAVQPTAAAMVTAAATVAASGTMSTVYPCMIADASCYCKWRGVLGYFADNDPTVGCK